MNTVKEILGKMPPIGVHFCPRLFLCKLLILGFLFALFPVTTKAAEDSSIKIAVIAHRGIDKAVKRWSPTAEYLSRNIPGIEVRMVPMALAEISGAVQRQEVDFVIVNPGAYIELENSYGIVAIATMIAESGGQAVADFGGVIFTRKDNASIRDFGDLVGKKFTAVSRISFGGFQMAWRELKAHGIDIDEDLASLDFTGFPQDKVVYAVRDGITDAGTVRTGILEAMAAENKIDLGDYRILNPQDGGFPLAVSTRLYPEWAFAKLPHTPPDVATKFATLLYGMNLGAPQSKAGKYAGWVVPASYGEVHKLFRELEIGMHVKSYDFFRSLSGRWEWIVFAGLILFVVLVYAGMANNMLAVISRKLNDRGRLFFLSLIMAGVAVSVTVIAMVGLYDTAFEVEKSRLSTFARTQAGLINAVSLFEFVYSQGDNKKGSMGATLSQIDNAFRYLGSKVNSEEIIIGRRDGDRIVYLTRSNIHKIALPPPVPWSKDGDAAMFLALSGQSGTIRTVDENGRAIVAAYEPIPNFNGALVARVRVKDIQSPFIKTGLLTSIGAMVVIFLGVLLFRRISSPLIARLETLIESLGNAQRIAHIGNWEWNMISGSLHWSDETYRIFGFQPQEFPPTIDAFFDVIHSDDRQNVRQTIDDALGTLEPYQIEHRVVLPEGIVHWVEEQGEVVNDENGEAVMMRGTVQDITGQKLVELEIFELNRNLEQRVRERTQELELEIIERRQTQELLRDSEERTRAIVDSAADGIITINQSYAITSFNAAAEKIFGYEARETMGKNINILVPEEHYEKHDGYIAHYIETGEAKIIGIGREVKGLHKDGSTFPMELALSVTEIAGGKVFTGIVRDISERKKAEVKLRNTLKELKLMQNELVQSEKMASLGGLVAGVAHEINTPVGIGVTASTHLEETVKTLRKSLADGTLKKSLLESSLESIEQASKIIFSNLRRAAELIGSFKQVAVDQSSEERRIFFISEYLDEIILSLMPQIKKTKHHIEIDCDAKIQINSFPGAISQIITNLVTNSLIHAFGDDEEGTIRIGAEENGGQVVIRYSDDGKGMEEKNRKRIFDPFFTTKRGSGGSGLGMHILFNLVTQTLGGTVVCESAPGEGASFKITFPAEVLEAKKMKPSA